MDEFGDERVIVIKITPEKSQPMYVVNAYLPSSNYSYEGFYSSVAGLIEIYECLRQCGQVIIAGDLNTCINMGTRRHISTGHDTRRIETVNNFVCNTDQYSVVTDIMCGGPVGTFCPHNTSVMTQIDHIIMDKSMYTLVSEAYVHDDNVINSSDHLPVSMTPRVDVPRMRLPVQTRSVYKWERADLDQYRTILTQQLESRGLCHDVNIQNVAELNLYYERLVICIIQSADQTIPTTRFNNHLRPFWSPELKALHKEKKRLRAIWVRGGKPRGMSHDSYGTYKDAKRVFSKQYKCDAATFEEEQLNKVANDMEMDHKMFWRYVNRTRQRPDNYHAIQDGDDIITKPEEQATMWMAHFKGLLNESTDEFLNYDN